MNIGKIMKCTFVKYIEELMVLFQYDGPACNHFECHNGTSPVCFNY
jgi:hypothetical protein